MYILIMATILATKLYFGSNTLDIYTYSCIRIMLLCRYPCYRVVTVNYKHVSSCFIRARKSKNIICSNDFEFPDQNIKRKIIITFGMDRGYLSVIYYGYTLHRGRDKTSLYIITGFRAGAKRTAARCLFFFICL